MNRQEMHRVLESEGESDVALDDLQTAWKISRAQEMTSSVQSVVVAASHWFISSFALLLVFVLLAYMFCYKRRASSDTTVVTVPHVAVDNSRLDQLERRINAQNDTISSLRHEIDRLRN